MLILACTCVVYNGTAMPAVIGDCEAKRMVSVYGLVIY